MKHLSKEQSIQEEQYSFPYHYLSLYSDVHRELIHSHYLSILRTSVELLKPFTGQKLLDVGCGDGRFCFELRHENINTIGIDYSKRAIAFAKAFNPSGKFFVGDITKFSYKNYFDIVTLVEVLEHIPPNDIEKFVASLHQLIKPGGRLLVSVPSINLPIQEKHYQHFTLETLLNHFGNKFDLIEGKGHTKSGSAWKRYVVMRKLAQFFWPLRGKNPFVNKYIHYVINYYKSIERCDINQAISIILLLEKK